MTPHEEIKRELRRSVPQTKSVTEHQLEVATLFLEKKASVRKSDIEFIGENVVGDSHIFASTDIDEINDVLGRLGNR